MSSINFDNPWLLFIALPLIVLVTVPFALAIRKDNVNAHNVASGIIHIVMAALIAFAAAGASVVTTVTQTDVYVLADVSYSASLNLDTVDEYIDDLSGNLPANSRMGVICFAKGHRIVTRLGDRFTTVKDSGVDDSSTNIVDALSYAGSLFRDDVIKRIVLITDGKSTDGSSDDALRRQINSLAERNIHVDAIFLDNNVSGDVTEVQLSEADYSSSVSLNRQESVTLTVQANCPDGSSVAPVITLYKDGELYKTVTPAVNKGENSVKIDLDTSVAGVHDYRAVIECDGDSNANNNELSFTQTVSGKVSILLISDNYDDDACIKNLLASRIADGSAEVTSYIQRTADVPVTVEELCRYDEIIISDFDVSGLDACETFINSLDTVVSQYGKSLLTFGDTSIQGRSDTKLDALSDILPVYYGQSEEMPKLYTLLIDTSRSMETLYKLDRAKEAAKQIVNMLSSDDMVAIVEFNGDAYVPQQPVSISSGRENVITKIEDLTVRQGTVMGSGFEYARNIMAGGNYGEKRLILISDGLDSGSTDVLATVKEMRADDIYTTVLDVGRGNDTGAAATAAKTLLSDIAKLGKPDGEALDISTTANLEKVINDELPENVSDYIGGLSYINVNRRRDELLNGIDYDEVASNYVSGYIKSQAKPNASTVLEVSYYYSVTVDGETIEKELYTPLYSYWKYGNGRAASFTSTLTGEWSGSGSSAVRDSLFANIIDTNTPDEKTDYPFLFTVERGSGSASVTVAPSNLRNDAWAKYSITMPDGTTAEGDMSFGSLSYGYSFVTPSEGKYAITVTYGYGDYTATATKYLNIDYSSEYDSFALYDASALIRGVGANGKVSTDGKLVIENDESEVGRYNLSLAMPLLVACVALYAIDIAVRKLKWEDIRSLFGRGKK